MIGLEIHNLAKALWKLNRSITGDGLRKTLEVIQKKHIPTLKIFSVATGTKVFDWTVPQEWKVSKAYIITPNKTKICDFSVNNLHLVGYSVPFKGKLKLRELQKYLHSLPDQPDAIPYVTSYYKRQWGFCIAHSEREKLVDGDYKVVVETKLFNGELNYGEIILKGSSEKEIFMSTYICHPSMANNELSGPTVTTFIVKWLMEIKNRYYTYRIIFIPETIGAIVYLKKNYKTLKKNVIAGFNVTCVGDERSYSYLASRNGDTLSDKVAKHILKFIDNTFKSYSWLERGSDERQYCSPGIDLPVVSIMRTKYFEYPEYHTSLDNLENVVTPKGLDGGYWALRKSLEAIEKNKKYVSNNLCEPQLGKRGLYPDLSTKETRHKVERILNLLSLCDGKNSLLDIAEILNVKIWDLYEHIDVLLKYHLISEVDE